MSASGSSARAPAVYVRGLERRFGPQRALRGVDLDVAEGTTLALLGANGAGKTTLVRVLAGLLRPTRGEVRIFGEVAPPEPSVRRRIGLLAHESFLYGDLSATENLVFYGRLYGVSDPGRIEAALSEVGLHAVADRPVRTFSRGMQQRLALARATLHDPELLLLDEPLTGLDAAAAEAFAHILERLRARGATAVFTTHDIERGVALADRVVILDRGRLTWQSDGRLPSAEELRARLAASGASAPSPTPLR